MNPLLSTILAANCLADFVSPAEIARGRALEERLQHLQKQRLRYKIGMMRGAVEGGRADYLAAPTDENLDKFERVALLYASASHGIRIADAVSEVFFDFIQREMIPWSTAILARAAMVVREHLAEVSAIESERTLEIIGQPMRHSDVVDAVRAVLTELEKECALAAAQSAASVRPPSHWLALLGYRMDSNKPSWEADCLPE